MELERGSLQSSVETGHEEMATIENNDTWEIVTLIKGFCLKWVYTLEFNPDGSFHQFKTHTFPTLCFIGSYDFCTG